MFVVVVIHTIYIGNALTYTNFNFGWVFYEQITSQLVLMLICVLFRILLQNLNRPVGYFV